MELIWRLLYNILFLPLLSVAYYIYAIFNPKARIGIKGRRDLFKDLRRKIPFERGNKRYVIWFHCSSVGELEQAKPIVAKIRDRANVVMSFFSPSGYAQGRKYQLADIACYLPYDTARNAKKMFELIKPSILIFVRFDVWPNYVWRAKKAGVPVMLIDAALHKESTRLLPIVRSFLKSVHKHIDLHCAISEADAERLRRLCPKDAKIEVLGDTRFDQVIARRSSALKKLEGLLPDFNCPVIIAGSTYSEDERVVLNAYQRVLTKVGNVQLILVPHEPEPEHLTEIERALFERGFEYVFLSKLVKEKHKGEVIVVDSVGLLAELYIIGDVVFVGGSFHGRVHNVMEPAVMGKPVLFGPMIQNSLEASMLVQNGGGIMVRDSDELSSELIRLLMNDELRKEVGKSALRLIEENAGATDKIVKAIEKFLPELCKPSDESRYPM